MEDLTCYNEEELSLRVFNDEYFYIERTHTDYLIALLDEEFEYTPEQLEVLLDDLNEED